MKRILYMAGMLLATSTGISAQDGVLADVRVVNEEVKKQGGEVAVRMTLDLSGLKVGTQQSVRLWPVIVSHAGDRELTLDPIVVDGRTRSLVHRREKALTGTSSIDNAHLVANRKDTLVEYVTTLPYEYWMTQSRLALRQTVTGCLECQEGTSVEETPVSNSFLELYKPTYATAFVQPQPEPDKRRNVERVARLQYRQDSYKIDPKFKNNQSELDSVSASIELVKTNPDLTIRGIYITGWASPEGTVEYNKRLSQRRADALAEYARKDTHTDASLWHVTGMGEDWEGLREEVKKHPRLLKIDEVLRIIDECDGDQDVCEKRIRALVPPDIYQRLLNEMYGPLRRNEYRIEFHVRDFTLEEAKELIDTRPELLSVAEIYAVADSYGRGTPEYRNAMLTAARTYPGKVSPVVNAAWVEMEAGDLQSAIRVLKDSKVSGEPEVLNALGVAYARDKQYDLAKETLVKARDAGSTEAVKNLKELANVMADL